MDGLVEQEMKQKKTDLYTDEKERDEGLSPFSEGTDTLRITKPSSF